MKPELFLIEYSILNFDELKGLSKKVVKCAKHT